LKKLFTKLLFIPLGFALLTPTFAQDGLEATLQEMAENNAQGYLGPIVTAFGTGANSGTFHRAKPHKILGFDLTLNATMVTIPEEAQEFEFYIPTQTIPVTVTYNHPIDGATDVTMDVPFNTLYSPTNVPSFFGDTDGGLIPVNETETEDAIKAHLVDNTPLDATQVENTLGSDISTIVGNLPALETPGGIGIPIWPSIMPQFSVGLPMNVELTFRGFSTETPDGDEVSFKGFGAKVGFSEFIPLFPVALSAGFYSTNLNLVDVVTATNTILTLQASKSIPFITVYGGLGLENSKMNVEYEFDPGVGLDAVPIEFEMKGDNKTRFIAGLRLKLALLSINADINAGEYTAYNLGVGLTLR
jgi:hypothetical protein